MLLPHATLSLQPDSWLAELSAASLSLAKLSHILSRSCPQQALVKHPNELYVPAANQLSLHVGTPDMNVWPDLDPFTQLRAYRSSFQMIRFWCVSFIRTRILILLCRTLVCDIAQSRTSQVWFQQEIYKRSTLSWSTYSTVVDHDNNQLNSSLRIRTHVSNYQWSYLFMERNKSTLCNNLALTLQLLFLYLIQFPLVASGFQVFVDAMGSNQSLITSFTIKLSWMIRCALLLGFLFVLQ